MNGIDDLNNLDFDLPATLITDVALPSDFVDIYSPYYNPVSGDYEYMDQAQLASQSPPSEDKSIFDLVGKVIDVAGKTYTEIAKQKNIQNYKVVPQVQTDMAKQVYLPLTRTRQTGLDTGILTSPEKGLVSGVPNIYLLIGIGLIIFITMR